MKKSRFSESQILRILKEALAVEAEFSYPSVRVINVLDRLVEFNGKSSVIRVDNGTEFTSDVFKQWCKTNYVKI